MDQACGNISLRLCLDGNNQGPGMGIKFGYHIPMPVMGYLSNPYSGIWFIQESYLGKNYKFHLSVWFSHLKHRNRICIYLLFQKHTFRFYLN